MRWDRSLRMDAPVVVAGHAVAAIVRRTTAAAAARGGVAAWAEKAPVAILTFSAGALIACDMTGAPIAPARVEAMVPGAAATLAAAWQAARDA
jgi:hypothetical protein